MFTNYQTDQTESGSIKFEMADLLDSPTYATKTDQEIKDLALALYRNDIFTSLQIQTMDFSILRMIFLPLVFLPSIQIKAMVVNKIHMFYAYYKDQGPRSINGYPIFHAFGMLDYDDTVRFVEKYKAVKQAMESL